LVCALLIRGSHAALAESSQWHIELSSGGRVVGVLGTRELKLQTEFGVLTVPVDQIQRLTPGLVSRPETERKVTSLLDDLGSKAFDVRERAQRELATFGSRIREILDSLRTDDDPERRLRARKLLAEIGRHDSAGPPWRRRDVIITAEQRIVGRLQPAELKVETPHGTLQIPLSEVESLGPPPSRRAIDLLKELDVSRDSVVGQWKWEGAALVSPKANRVRVQVPVVPPPEYELRATVLPKDGRTLRSRRMADSLFVGLVVGGRACYVALNAFADVGGPFTGLDTLDGKRMHLKALHHGRLFELGREAKIACSVRKHAAGASVALAVDGKPIFAWTGDPKQLGVSGEWALRDSRYLGIGSHQTIYHISGFELVPIDEPTLPRKLEPGEYAVRFADGTLIAARTDDAQMIALRVGEGERKLKLSDIKSWRPAAEPGATTVMLFNNEVLTGKVSSGPIEWTTRLGKLTASVQKSTHVERAEKTDAAGQD
jgi:hypothetical protein